MGLALEGRAHAPDVLAAGKCPGAPRGPARRARHRTAAGGRARRLKLADEPDRPRRRPGQGGRGDQSRPNPVLTAPTPPTPRSVAGERIVSSGARPSRTLRFLLPKLTGEQGVSLSRAELGVERVP